MKFGSLILLVTLVTALGEDAPVETVTVETPKTAAQATSAEQSKLDAERKAKKALEETPITYSGFLVELSRAEKKSKLLSLRQPLDPKTDYKYLHFDEKTSRPKGFVLFSLDF